MNWLPTLRKKSDKRSFAWQTPGTQCWLLNHNVAPIDKVFLGCTITRVSGPESNEVAVKLDEQLEVTDISVDKSFLFRALPHDHHRDAFSDDLAQIYQNSDAEVFHFLLEKLNQKDRYFYCGTDLFHINDWTAFPAGNSESPEQTRKALQKAVDWLFKEELLKTEFAHPAMFVSEILKRFIWTGEQQAVFLCGETESGKSGNVTGILDALAEYNLSNFSPEKIESLKAVRASMQKRVSKIEEFINLNEDQTIQRVNSILPTQAQEKKFSATRPNQPTFLGGRQTRGVSAVANLTEAQKNFRREVYSAFNKEVRRAVKIANLFVQVYQGGDKFSNGGCLKLLLEADDECKFVGFQISVSVLQSFKVIVRVSSLEQRQLRLPLRPAGFADGGRAGQPEAGGRPPEVLHAGLPQRNQPAAAAVSGGRATHA